MQKRGLSSVVTTIILILLILVAIASIWAVVNNLIVKGSADVSLRKLTVDLDVVSAEINYSSGIATVRVLRNQGEGNVTGIKILISSKDSTEIVTKYLEGFDELEKRTFMINLTEEASNLNLTEIAKITVVPIIVLESEKEVLGQEDQGVSGLNKLFLTNELNTDQENPGGECTSQDLSECEAPGWILGTNYCNQNNFQIMEWYMTTNCVIGFCVYDNELRVKETCAEGQTCFDGTCLWAGQTCDLASDCGTEDYIGLEKCMNLTTIGKDYQTFTCTQGLCDDTLETLPIRYCEEGTFCYSPSGIADCFTPVECAVHEDCELGEICVEGFCEIEYALNNGTINSIWPFFIGEYFDSAELPTIEEDYTGYYIIFPFSDENRCMQITEHVYPNKTGAYAYVRLNESITNISTGDLYEVWETGNACL
jgi:flagellin-like protein